jgi:hypothetical protein
VCRLALNGTTLFEEHLADIANCGSQQIAPLILWSKQYQIDEALAHFCNQVGQIDLVIANAFNVLPHHLIDFAVQTTFLCHDRPHSTLWHPLAAAIVTASAHTTQQSATRAVHLPKFVTSSASNFRDIDLHATVSA